MLIFNLLIMITMAFVPIMATNITSEIYRIPFINEVETVDKFIPTIISYSIFLLFLLGSSIIQYCLPLRIYRVFYRSTYIKRFKSFSSIGRMLFVLVYSSWWTGYNILSVYYEKSKSASLTLGICTSINMSLLLIPISKLIDVSEVFDSSAEVLRYSHGLIGFMTLVSAVLKVIVVSIENNPSCMFQLISNGGSQLAGTIATLMLFLLSLALVIKFNKRSFSFLHKSISFVLVTTSIWHYNLVMYYLVFPLILTLISIIWRIKKTYPCVYSRINKISNHYIDLEIIVNDKINTQAGCYFLICSKNLSWFEWHPFSLISYKHNTFKFCAKITTPTSWTEQLSLIEDNIETTEQLLTRQLYIQGPYSNFKFIKPLNEYKVVVFIASGISITPILNLINNLSKNLTVPTTSLPTITGKHEVSISKINLIWIVSDYELITHFNYHLLDMNHTIVDISVYYTGQNTRRIPTYIKSFKPSIQKLLRKEFNGYDCNDICSVVCANKNIIHDCKLYCYNMNIDCYSTDFS